MKRQILHSIVISALSLLSLCASDCDSGSEKELQEINSFARSPQKSEALVSEQILTWKKRFTHLHPELYEGTQTLSDGRVIRLIAFSEKHKNDGGTLLSSHDQDPLNARTVFKTFPLTVPCRIDQVADTHKHSPIIPQRKKYQEHEKIDDGDSIII